MMNKKVTNRHKGRIHKMMKLKKEIIEKINNIEDIKYLRLIKSFINPFINR